MPRVSKRKRSEAGKNLRDKDPEAGRLLNALRKTHGAGPGIARRKPHNPSASYCLCVDCRIKRGHYKPKYTQ